MAYRTALISICLLFILSFSGCGIIMWPMIFDSQGTQYNSETYGPCGWEHEDCIGNIYINNAVD